MSEPTEPTIPAVKSARRAMELLDHFDQVQRPQSLTEVSAALGYPASSTLALLRSLQELDYLSYDLQTRQFSPTLRVAMLGAWIQGRLFRDGVLVDLMERLRDATGETIVLGMLNDLRVQYVHVVQAKQVLRLHLYPGTFRPAHRTAVGLALLARQNDDRVARLARRLERQTGTAINLPELQARLSGVRENGFAWTANQITEGAGTLAMLGPPLADGRDLALGVAGPLTRLEPARDRILASLRGLIAGAAGGPGGLAER